MTFITVLIVGVTHNYRNVFHVLSLPVNHQNNSSKIFSGENDPRAPAPIPPLISCRILPYFLRTLILDINLVLCSTRNAKNTVRFELLGEPVLFEPLYCFVPSFSESDNWLESQILFGRLDVEPSVHCEDDDVEPVEFHGHSE